MSIYRIHLIWLLTTITFSEKNNALVESVFHGMKKIFCSWKSILQSFQNYHKDEWIEVEEVLNENLISFKSLHSFLLYVLFNQTVFLKDGRPTHRTAVRENTNSGNSQMFQKLNRNNELWFTLNIAEAASAEINFETNTVCRAFYKCAYVNFHDNNPTLSTRVIETETFYSQSDLSSIKSQEY